MTFQLSSLILTGYFHLTCLPGAFDQKVAKSLLLIGSAFWKAKGMRNGMFVFWSEAGVSKTRSSTETICMFRPKLCFCIQDCWFLISLSRPDVSETEFQNQIFRSFFRKAPDQRRTKKMEEKMIPRSWYSNCYTGLKWKQASVKQTCFYFAFLYSYFV